MTLKNKFGLNAKQLEAVNHKDGPILIAAGAGSGKTKTLTSRIANLIELGVGPENILAITFTNKAAKEMKNRIGNIENIFVGTFHSFGAKVLRQEHLYLQRTANFTIFDEDDSLSLLKQAMKNLNLSKDKHNPLVLKSYISKIKSELLDSDKSTVEGALFEEYENFLKRNNAFDFDDLIEKPIKLFNSEKKILKKYQDQYHHVLVDEYQDINTAQYHLIKLLAQNHQNLSVVGDDAQSIYAFRGADFRNFLNFEKHWPKAKIVLLEENYRSTPNILRAANEIIKNNKLQKQKNLWTKNSSGEIIKLFAAEDEEAEANWITNQIMDAIRQKTLPSQMAILYRTNAQSRAIEQSLIFKKIPYQIFGGIRFYERKEIKDIVAGLRFANNSQDTVSAERLIKNFSKTKSSDLIGNLPRLSKELTTVQLLNYIINNTNYIEYLENNFKNYQERIENVKELISFASNFTKERGLSEFLEQVSLAQGHDNSKNQDGVNLMTIHLSKGLEFDTVFIAGCSEGVLPHHRSYGTNEELEEERRLMYVAVTRAAKRLFLSFANIPSRFLYEISPELIQYDAPQPNKKHLPDEDEMHIEYE